VRSKRIGCVSDSFLPFTSIIHYGVTLSFGHGSPFLMQYGEHRTPRDTFTTAAAVHLGRVPIPALLEEILLISLRCKNLGETHAATKAPRPFYLLTPSRVHNPIAQVLNMSLAGIQRPHCVS